MFETSLPDEIILKICHYLSWFDVFIAFYNLNTRLNQTIRGYLTSVSIGDDCCLKQIRSGCGLLLNHQSSLFHIIRTCTISNRGSPLAAKYFLSHIPIHEMIYLEKIILIEVTGEEILSYLDIIERADYTMFQHLTTFEIHDPRYIDSNHSQRVYHNDEEQQQEYESNMINRILTGNNYRFKSIAINGDYLYMQTNMKNILNPCFNLHTLSIMMTHHDDLISLFTLIPNIRCLHLSLRRTYSIVESSLWSSVVLPDLVEFYFWTELAHELSMEELIILLRIMPALRRVLLNINTRDVRLLDGEQVRSIFSAANILSLDKFNYAVEYSGETIRRHVICQIPHKWSQPIALTFDVEYRNVCLHTIPVNFRLFWARTWSPQVKKILAETNLTRCYGEHAYIDHCYLGTSQTISELYGVMQKSYRVKKLTLYLFRETERHIFESDEEPVTSMSVQQQRFNLTSLCLSGSPCDSIQLIEFLITFGSHLRRLHIDFNCLLNLINDVNDNTRLKDVMFHKYLVYLELDTICESYIDSEDFSRVTHFLFNNENSLRHVIIFPGWYLQIFQSADDMRLLLKILSSFKSCTQLISIVISRCIFSNQSCNNSEIRSIENDIHTWLNDNTHLILKHNFDLECDTINRTIKLWLN